MSEDELAQGWVWVPLKELIAGRMESLDPSKFPQEEFELYSVPSFGDGNPEIALGNQIKSSKQVVLEDDVLLCKIIPHLNRVWVVKPKSGRRQIASGEWIVCRNHGCDAHYLRYYLSEQSFRGKFLETVSGVGGSLLRASPKLVKEIEIPIAAHQEQRRIVAKVDNLFAKTKRAREELGHIPRLVEHYKQAIFAAAFRGDLTAEWRHKQLQKPVQKHPSSIDGRATQLPLLPREWRWSNVGDHASVAGGLTKNSKRDGLPKKVPYLRVANVYANELRLDDVSEIGCTDREKENTLLELGDVLVVEGNGSIEQIGRVALWDGTLKECSHQNHLIRVRSDVSVRSRYLLYWMLSPEGRTTIQAVASSSSGLHTLSISKVRALPFPMCSTDEMDEIVNLIEKALAWIGRIAQEHASASRLIDRLDQAILSKAFRGELVPQDPNDEPASVLLERIRAERAARGDAPRRRGRRKAAAG